MIQRFLRPREREVEKLSIPPHFQKLFRWDSKFDWFCLACVVFIFGFILNLVVSVPGAIAGWF